jgi:5,10-methylenetetrahydromethanopterin reductase
MRFGLRVPLFSPARETAAFIRRTEQAGFDYAWLPDSQLIARDVWATLALAAVQTSRIVLSPNVTNPVTRHPTVTACAAATIDDLAAGRFVLGIGSGDASLRMLGWKTARIAQLRECIELLRPLWAGEFVAPYGRSFKLRAVTGRRIPIYVSASGPNMLQFAGEVADGLITVAGITPDALDYLRTNLEIGARRAGRKLDEIDIALGLYCYIDDDWEACKRQAQPYAATYAMRHPEMLRQYGIPVPEPRQIHGVYPGLLHAENWEDAIAATDWLPDELREAFCQNFCLMGSLDQVRARIRELASLGVDNLYIRGLYTYRLPTDLCDTFASEIIPHFRQG